MQRAYDNIIHDVALPKLHVIFCIDRAGIVGNDGATHHGLLDLAYLRPIPNMVIGAPMTEEDLQQMMELAKDYEGPIAIRYPRGRSQSYVMQYPTLHYPQPVIGKAVCLREGSKVAVLSIGAIGNTVECAIELLGNKADQIAHYDMRWLKPLDETLLREISDKFDQIITIEDGVINGGLGSAVLEWTNDHGYHPQITRMGVNDQFVEHGSTQELYQLLCLDQESIADTLLKCLEKK